MKVRILKSLAGPTRTCWPGQVLELPDDEAQRYIEAQAAESLEPSHASSPEPAPIETATAEPEVETPEAPRPKRGRARA